MENKWKGLKFRCLLSTSTYYLLLLRDAIYIIAHYTHFRCKRLNCTSHSSKYFINSFLWSRWDYAHFPYEESDTERSKLSYPRVRSLGSGRGGIWTRMFALRVPNLHPKPCWPTWPLPGLAGNHFQITIPFAVWCVLVTKLWLVACEQEWYMVLFDPVFYSLTFLFSHREMVSIWKTALNSKMEVMYWW